MGARSKVARKVRNASEFDLGRLLNDAVREPRAATAVYAWSLSEIFDARNQQMLGSFRLPARLAESIRTDDALFTARKNRIAPSASVKVMIKPGTGARAGNIAKEADAHFGPEGVAIRPDTIRDIHGCLADHGLAFGINHPRLRDDGSRVDFVHRAWPIEHVRWDATNKVFKTRVADGPEETIVHADGRWTIYANEQIEPFKHGVIVPAAVVWARHAFAARDWSKGSSAHGSARVMGELPQGIALQDKDGLTPDARQFLQLLLDMATADTPVGIRPAGSKTEWLTNTSAAWQVFKELVTNAEQAAARIYLGTDGILGSKGGAPGVDITALFGVAATLVEGDLGAIERGIREGVIEPWCALNFGDSTLAPKRAYLLPDVDADAQRDAVAKRRQAFYADIKAAKDLGFEITQEFCNEVAAVHGVSSPKLATVSNPAAGAVATE